MGVDLSDIGDELTSFWAEVQYRVMDYWVETENVQRWATSGGGDGDESVVDRQRMAFVACWRLMRRAPRKPETGTGSPAVVVYWQALSLLSLIHSNEGRTVPSNVWNGMGPGPGDDHQPGADDLAWQDD
jgi:hypothetical protein